MRLSAAFDREACLYRVYDYPAGSMRRDLCWVDDGLNQVGVGFAAWGQEFVTRVEQRKRILIIPGVYWIALDLPEEEAWVMSEAGGWKKPNQAVLKVESVYGKSVPNESIEVLR